jgi:ABC-type Zn uptake system ZnuABC Zn-binding protein ZnuA
VQSPAWVLAIIVLVAAFSGCSGGCRADDPSAGRTRVTVSIFPLYDLVRRVAGQDADVWLLLPAGHSEHSFDPTPKDIERVARAKLGVMVGLGLDPWMEKLMKDVSPNAHVLKVGERVPTRTIQEEPVGTIVHGHDHDREAKGALDPHVWLDPQRAELIVRAVADELVSIDAAHAAAYRERASEVEKSLALLDQEAAARLGALKGHGFVTFHGSFGYFADRYGLSILAVIEPFPGSHPTGDYVSKVLSVIKDKNVPALFSEPQLDPHPARVLAEEAKIPLGVLDPVGGGSETETYEKTIRFDVAQLEKHLR